MTYKAFVQGRFLGWEDVPMRDGSNLVHIMIFADGENLDFYASSKHPVCSMLSSLEFGDSVTVNFAFVTAEKKSRYKVKFQSLIAE